MSELCPGAEIQKSNYVPKHLIDSMKWCPKSEEFKLA
jgi:hypothetical protein